MYLSGIALTRTYPCLAEPGKIIVDGKPAHSLAEVIPYLAALPGIIAYNPDAPTLTFRRQPGFLTLYANRVTITQVRDAEEGLALLAALVEAVNATCMAFAFGLIQQNRAVMDCPALAQDPAFADRRATLSAML